MPLRGFLYAGKLYDKYIVKQNITLYGDILITLPTPQYYVFYNGTDETEDRMELRLSDAFADSSVKEHYEWTAILLNINHGRNKELMKKCRMLNEYAKCVAIIREHAKDDSDWEHAIRTAVDVCIQEGILKDFLKENKAEVIEMLLTEYDEQKTLEQLRIEYRKLGIKEGLELGIKQGVEQGIKQGESDGIRMMQFVTGKLIEEKRFDELTMASKDEQLIRRFAQEFGYSK